MARTVTVAMLIAGVLLLAAPASAEHDPDGDGQFCVDSSTAHAGDGLFTDTMTAGYCIVASAGGSVPDAEIAGEIGGVGAVPTRIDAGAGGAAQSGNLVAFGGVVTAAAAAAAGAVRLRRRT